MTKPTFIKYKNIYVVPTFHSRVEFAKIVRANYFKVFPDLIAVELPSNIREEVIEGVNRLPYLSLIAYADSLSPELLNFIPIDPSDSIIEGIRMGQEYNVPVEFIDLSLKTYKAPVGKLPDDYSINKIGLPQFYKIIANQAQYRQYREQKLTIEDKVSLQEYFEKVILRRKKEKKMQQQAEEKQVKTEKALEKYKKREQSRKGGPKKSDEKLKHIEKDILREKYMASNLLRMMPLYNRILLIVGMAHWKSIKYYLEHPEKIESVNVDLVPFKYVKIYNIKNSDARYLLKEIPYHTYQWINFRDKYSKTQLEQIEDPSKLFQTIRSYNKKHHIREIFLKAKEDYEKEFKEFINFHNFKNIFQYSRNLTLINEMLLPRLYQLLVTAKNIVDDDYAWKVYKIATKYPFNDESEDFETMDLSALGGMTPDGHFVRLRRRHPYPYSQKDEIPMEKRPEEKYEGEWREEWEKNKWRAVSYPPEDKLEEDYFEFIRKKTLKNLKSKRVRIEEFKSSLKDGIAIKETIRKWAYEQKIYVKNEQKIQGRIDTLVVIFDKDDGKKEKYPHKFNWYAEHKKESNLVLYTTNPGDYLVGPGISHVEVGGLLSIYPPTFIHEVFREYMDYQYEDCKNKAERLLKAAILNSKEKYIVYIAKSAPRKYFYSMAGVKHRKIVYVPLNNFNRDSLKTIKHIHLLAGHDKRDIAHKYIFLNK
ncbi:MAG: hypothetical protein R6U96_18125 [Promethearchaeia archaeon]